MLHKLFVIVIVLIIGGVSTVFARKIFGLPLNDGGERKAVNGVFWMVGVLQTLVILHLFNFVP